MCIKSILDKKYLFYPAGPFYCNMKILSNCPYSKKTSPAWKNSWLLSCLYKALIFFTAFGALITFAEFVKFIPSNLGIFQHSNFYLLKFLPVCIFSYFLYVHIFRIRQVNRFVKYLYIIRILDIFVWNKRSVIYSSSWSKKSIYTQQKSFSYLTKSCNIFAEQSFIQAVSRFDMITGFRYVLLDFSVCVSLQYVSGSMSKSYLSQNKWEKSDPSKTLYIYDDYSIGGWGILKICHVFVDSVFEQLIYCSFCRQWWCG